MPTIKNKFFRYIIRSEHLYDRQVFHGFLFLSSILALVVWWGVYSSVQQNIDARMDNEVARIESNIRVRVSIYENSLRFLRVFFQLGNERAFESYQELIRAADIQNRWPGIRGVGIASLVKKEDIKYHTRRQKILHRGQYQLQPAGDREIYAPVVAFEPMADYSAQFFGLDLLSDPVRGDAIHRAIRSGETELSGPIQFLTDHPKYGKIGFLIMLPFFNQEKVPETSEERQKKVIGLLYMPVRPQVFFEGILGKPNEKTEIVNFKIISADDATESLALYTRFDRKSEKGLYSKTKVIDLNGSKWKIEAEALPRFYNFSDRYAALIVALIEILLISLAAIVYRLMFNKIISEKTAKEIIRASERNSQVHTRQLKLLNKMSQEISAELEVEKMAEHFFKCIHDISEATHSVLYLLDRNEEASPVFKPTHMSILTREDLRCSQVPANELVSLLRGKGPVIRRSSEGARQIFDSFFRNEKPFSDWIFTIVPSRDEGICAVFFIGKERGPGFTENVLEIVDSLVSQFATSIENANLLKRTEDSNNAKSQFLANMSHEIRTPLNAIIGFSEMLTKKDFQDRKQELISSIQKNGEQLTRLIDDILDISKVEAGKLQIVRRKVSLQNLLREVAAMMEERVRAKGIEFKIDWDLGVPRIIEIDELRLKQIIFNVVGNAIKFTERGSVHLHVSSCKKENKFFIQFSVKDSGIGISAKDQVKLFRPFQQGDSSNTRKFGGTGLGLALSKKLANELGGDLSLQASRLGQGSTFFFEVDAGFVLDQESLSLEAQAESPIVSGDNEKSNVDALVGKRIMVVEDSEDNQDIFEYFLKSAGAFVEIAGDGQMAVKMAQEKEFDLILMDIQLPIIDGKEATRQIRKNGYSKPIVALTAHAMPEERELCLKAGCNGQISKPVSGESLIKQLADFLHMPGSVSAPDVVSDILR